MEKDVPDVQYPGNIVRFESKNRCVNQVFLGVAQENCIVQNGSKLRGLLGTQAPCLPLSSQASRLSYAGKMPAFPGTLQFSWGVAVILGGRLFRKLR